MRIAIISVTDNGARLANKLAKKMTGDIDRYAKAGRDGGVAAIHYESLRDLVDKAYNTYDGLIFIMATGIVVRLIAAHVRDKRFDPAVVVMDEAGQFAISLLSGHIGGANDLARVVARTLGATPVITTATDVLQKPAPDALAVKIGLEIEPFEELKHINAAIVAGQRVAFFIDRSLPEAEHYVSLANEQGITPVDSSELIHIEKYDAAVVISDKEMYMVKPHIFLRPATLAVGLGCRRGTTSAELYTAIVSACKRIGRSAKSIAVIATTTAKEDEIGLLAMVQQMAVPLEVYENDQLQACIDKYGLKTSDFVEDTIGVGNVCEPAALLAAGADSLLLARTVYDKITVAIAEVKYRSWA